jgi:2-polyprenyl-6-hydroxyphenyl methylase/3-demethylubiquinone-9 3-methyltransferase
MSDIYMKWKTNQDDADCMRKPKLKVSTWDHSSHERFYDYYAKASQSQKTLQRFRSIRDCVLKVVDRSQFERRPLEIADIGCGTGTQSMMWAELGHNVHALDVNEPLVKLARERSAKGGYVIDFQVGSAVEMPWADASMDVCLVPELLEHVAEWKTCLNECTRILGRGGVLFLTTTNKLCPIQQEFNLPLYSWYPAPFKRHFEHIAVTTRQDLANFARYPAVNWFTFYSLRAALVRSGFQCLDRFDVMDLSKKSTLAKLIVGSVRAVPVLRWLAHVATPGTIVVAIKGTSVSE